MIEALVDTAERLLATLEHETAVLRSTMPGQAAGLQEEKSRLAEAWSEGLTKIGTERSITPAEKDALLLLAKKLDTAVLENERVLRAATVATDRVISAIAVAIKEQRSCGVGYGKRREAPRTRAPASGIAVDRKL